MALPTRGRFGKKKTDLKNKRNPERSLFRRKKFCRFTADKIAEVDYKDIEILKDFINENGKIILVCIIGMKMFFQCQLLVAIKRARFLALLPYTDLH